jgi:tRNA G18 (ribose-2'-O)-methylase SpoU
MRGYYGIGIENVTKPYNVGNLFRSAHALDASFVFTVGAIYKKRQGKHADTSNSLASLPYYEFETVGDMILPKGCDLVGIEIVEGAIELPSFRHPKNAAYVLGPEMSSVSPELLAKCKYKIKIPSKFCLNVGIAGALVMYDRMISMKTFANRPVKTGGPTEPVKKHIHGSPLDIMKKYKTTPPLHEVEIAKNA